MHVKRCTNHVFLCQFLSHFTSKPVKCMPNVVQIMFCSVVTIFVSFTSNPVQCMRNVIQIMFFFWACQFLSHLHETLSNACQTWYTSCSILSHLHKTLSIFVSYKSCSVLSHLHQTLSIFVSFTSNPVQCMPNVVQIMFCFVLSCVKLRACMTFVCY